MSAIHLVRVAPQGIFPSKGATARSVVLGHFLRRDLPVANRAKQGGSLPSVRGPASNVTLGRIPCLSLRGARPVKLAHFRPRRPRLASSVKKGRCLEAVPPLVPNARRENTLTEKLLMFASRAQGGV